MCVCVWLSVSAIRPALFCSAESAESAQLCSAWLSMALQFCTPIVCTTTGYSNIPWLMLDHSGPLLPVPTSYLGTMDMYVYRVVVSAAQCTSLAPLHVRTHARTYRLHLHPSPALPATRAACRRAVGGRPVVRLSVSCAVCAALLLCGSCSPSCQCLPVASQCLACLSVCRPVRLAAWPEPAIKIIISRLPGTLYDTMLLPADPPHAGLSTWRPRYGLYGRSDSNGRQPSRDAHTRQCHPCPLLPPPGPPSHDSQLRAEPLIPCVLV